MALIEGYWFRRLGTLGMSEDLNQLRSAIDNLDNEILQALAKRMKLSDQVIAAKNGAVAFRPGREAALVRQLVINSKANGHDLSPSVILVCGDRLWPPALVGKMAIWPLPSMTW